MERLPFYTSGYQERVHFMHMFVHVLCMHDGQMCPDLGNNYYDFS